MKPLKNITIIYSSSRQTSEVLDLCENFLLSSGVRLVDSISIKDLARKKSKILKKSDLFLVIGGDGTMIASIRELHDYEIPFLGINLGRVGFLTDIYLKSIESLSNIFKGKYLKERRPIYKASFSERNQDIFVNEVVIHSGSVAKMANLELSSNSQRIYNLKADGMIISSSTGSTAYSYSGGGPIISPKVDAICLLPMFSHSSSSHSLILPNKQNINVKIKNKDIDVDIVVDGKKKLKYSKNGLEVSNTKKYFQLYHPKDYNYFDACRSKLGWALPIENLRND
tara:strand:- start:2443 stop:3291 length:849 start_codon:yes stop_codon:yes gene_type:complete